MSYEPLFSKAQHPTYFKGMAHISKLDDPNARHFSMFAPIAIQLVLSSNSQSHFLTIDH